MSNLLSNQKSIHSVSPLVASNGHEFLFEQVDYKGETAWAYLLLNKVNGMWYIGISSDDPNTYKTSSHNNALLSAWSSGSKSVA